MPSPAFLAEPARTVADRLAGIAMWRERIDCGRTEYGEDWAAKAHAHADSEEEGLRRFPPDMELLTVGAALRSDLLDAEQKWCVAWQRRNSGDYAPSPFESALFELIPAADDTNLARIELGFPVAANAYRRWTRERGFADSIRALPLAFSL